MTFFLASRCYFFDLFDKFDFVADPDHMNTIWPDSRIGRDHRRVEKQCFANRNGVAVEQRRPQQNVGVVYQMKRDGVFDIAGEKNILSISGCGMPMIL